MARLHMGERGTRQLWHEITIWTQLHHPFIVQLVGMAWHGQYPMVVSEFYEEGSLYEANKEEMRHSSTSPCDVQATSQELCAPRNPADQLKLSSAAEGKLSSGAEGPRSDRLLVEWMHNIASAMQYLHSLAPIPVLHRNLKSSNCLLTNRGQNLLVTDFNTSCLLTADMTPAVGSTRWMAPELLHDQAYSEKTDVYAYGMVCYEMLTRQLPFSSYSLHQAALKVSSGKRPALPTSCSRWVEELITACWQASVQAQS